MARGTMIDTVAAPVVPRRIAVVQRAARASACSAEHRRPARAGSRQSGEKVQKNNKQGQDNIFQTSAASRRGISPKTTKPPSTAGLAPAPDRRRASATASRTRRRASTVELRDGDSQQQHRLIADEGPQLGAGVPVPPLRPAQPRRRCLHHDHASHVCRARRWPVTACRTQHTVPVQQQQAAHRPRAHHRRRR